MNEQEKAAVTLGTLGEKEKLHSRLSVPAIIMNSPVAGPRAGCEQVEGRRAGGRGGLAGAQVPWLAGWRAQRMFQQRCQPHTKRAAELPLPAHRALSPAKQEPGGTRTRGCHQLCSAGSHCSRCLSCRGSAAAQTEGVQRARPSGAHSRTQPLSVMDPSNPVWGPSGLSRKGKNNRQTNILGCWG